MRKRNTPFSYNVTDAVFHVTKAFSPPIRYLLISNLYVATLLELIYHESKIHNQDNRRLSHDRDTSIAHGLRIHRFRAAYVAGDGGICTFYYPLLPKPQMVRGAF